MPGAVGDLGGLMGASESSGWDNVTAQLAQVAAGRGLQALSAMNQQMPQGMPPGGPSPPGAGPMPPGPPMAGASPGMGPPPPQAPQMPQGANARLMGQGQVAYNPPPGAPPGSFAGRFPQMGQGTLPNPGQAQAPPGAMPPPPQRQQPQPPPQQMPDFGMMGQQQGQFPPQVMQIVQAIDRANPGMPPNVKAAAVEIALKTALGPQMFGRNGLLNMQPDVAQAQAIARGDAPILTGYVSQTPAGRATMDLAYQINPGLSGATYRGNTAEAAGAGSATGRVGALTQPIGAQGDTLQSRQATERAFAPNGPNGKSVTSFNVVTQHLSLLKQVAQALEQGDKGIQTLNRLRTAWQQEFGSPIPTNFDAVKSIVSRELTKAILPGGGGVFDRSELGETIARWQGASQINEGIDNYVGLMAGQLDGQRKAYESGSGRNDFDQRFLSPATRSLIEGNRQSGQTQQQQGGGGNVIKYDAQGNRIGQ